MFLKGILIGFSLDLLFGDPYWLPHPIVAIGQLVKKVEAKLRLLIDKGVSEKRAGVFLTLIVVLTTYIFTFSLLKLLKFINPYIAWGTEVFMIFQILATKSLGKESLKVVEPLVDGDIEESRKFLSYIVGRDTKELSEKSIIRATIETIAENTSDGIIAPLFYIFIGGAPLGMAYKAVNTLDSMVGYKNEKYINFGWASAKFDDLINYIPARLTAIFMLIASMPYNLKNAFKIMLRDCKNHSSPNAGFPESVAAGALDIQLGGTNYYFGKRVVKPTIGDMNKGIELHDIYRMIRLMYMTAIVGCLLFTLSYKLVGLG